MTTTLTGLGFPEALRWHDGALWFSDMFRSRVVRWTPDAGVDTVLDRERGGPVMPGGLGWLPRNADPWGVGALLIVDCLERQVLAMRGDEVSVHADLRELMTHPANDMHVDADGTAWVGGYGFDPGNDPPAASSLVRIAADGRLSMTRAQFIFPNGCARDADGALLVAETFADRVTIAAADGGSLTRSVTLPTGSGPDGISLGCDGTVFVALAFAGELVAFDRRASATAGASAIRLVHRPAAIEAGPGAGPVACYDCAVEPGGRRIAVAIASADEALAEHVDTGRIELLTLEG